jgi:hypothetical protein
MGSERKSEKCVKQHLDEVGRKQLDVPLSWVISTYLYTPRKNRYTKIVGSRPLPLAKTNPLRLYEDMRGISALARHLEFQASPPIAS